MQLDLQKVPLMAFIIPGSLAPESSFLGKAYNCPNFPLLIHGATEEWVPSHQFFPLRGRGNLLKRGLHANQPHKTFLQHKRCTFDFEYSILIVPLSLLISGDEDCWLVFFPPLIEFGFNESENSLTDFWPSCCHLKDFKN